MYTSGGGGGGGKANYPTNGSNSQSFQVGPTSPLRVNPGQPARVINHESSYSVAKPTSPVARSDRSFPRSSIKQVITFSKGIAVRKLVISYLTLLLEYIWMLLDIQKGIFLAN